MSYPVKVKNILITRRLPRLRSILLVAGFQDRFRLRSVPLYWDLRRKTGGDQFQLVESRVSLAISGIHGRDFNRKSKRMQKILPEMERRLFTSINQTSSLHSKKFFSLLLFLKSQNNHENIA